ncbi:MAG: hypothetical protein ABIE36_01325 [Candidatus Diapherotrites archaeon]
MNIKTGLPNLNPKSLRIPEIKFRDLPKTISIGKSFRETGKEFQQRVKRDLIKKGYKVSKAHNIHYDLLAKKGNKKYVIECKASEKATFSPAEIEFSHKAKKESLIYKTATKSKTGRIIYKSL